MWGRDGHLLECPSLATGLSRRAETPRLCVPASQRVCRDQQELYRRTDGVFVDPLDACMSRTGLGPRSSGNSSWPRSAASACGLPLGVLLERLGELLLAHVRAALDAGVLGV